MYRILICDDEPVYINRLNSMIAKLFGSLFSSESCADADALLARLNTLPAPDLLFLDIELGDQNVLTLGDEIAPLLRETKVIYITAHGADYSQHIFLRGLTPFGFLVKPFDEALLKERIDDALADWLNSSRYLRIDLGREDVKVPVNEVLYVENFHHAVYVHTDQATYQVNAKFSEFKELLPAHFLQINRGCFINPARVDQLGADNAFRMDGSEVRLPISRSHVISVKKQYHDFQRSRL